MTVDKAKLVVAVLVVEPWVYAIPRAIRSWMSAGARKAMQIKMALNVSATGTFLTRKGMKTIPDMVYIPADSIIMAERDV
jgi:hypothetical protein